MSMRTLSGCVVSRGAVSLVELSGSSGTSSPSEIIKDLYVRWFMSY